MVTLNFYAAPQLVNLSGHCTKMSCVLPEICATYVPLCFPELIWPEYRILHDFQSNKCSWCLVTRESDPRSCITNPIIFSLSNPVSRLEWCACCYLCVKSSLLCLCLHDSDQTHVWECWTVWVVCLWVECSNISPPTQLLYWASSYRLYPSFPSVPWRAFVLRRWMKMINRWLEDSSLDRLMFCRFIDVFMWARSNQQAFQMKAINYCSKTLMCSDGADRSQAFVLTDKCF